MGSPKKVDPGLIEFCQTDRQREIFQAVIDAGSIRKAVQPLGLAVRNINYALARIRKNAALRGYAPEHHMTRTCPETHIVKGVSTAYNEEGRQVLQWVKTDLRKEALEAVIRETIEALREGIPKAEAQKASVVAKKASTDLLNLYVITDYHIGARAWPEETRGEAWDTDIAEDLLVRWFEYAIEQSPASETAVLAQLGDVVHYDSMAAVTPTSGHQLDSDTRLQRMVRVVIRVFRRVIAMLLEKHARVHVIMAEGNHDMASSAWLREVFSAFYLDEPRVTVDVSPDPYYCIEHGQTALYFHHGHVRKQVEIDRVFAAKFREAFGRTKHAYAHMGHYHHRKEVESALMIVRQHRTLAAADAYASRGGYISGREAQVVTYHKEHGEVLTMTISPEMVA